MSFQRFVTACAAPLLSLALAAPSHAQSTIGSLWYIGGGFSAVDHAVTAPDIDLLGLFDTSHTILQLRAGMPLNDYFDAEIRLGVGLGSDGFNFSADNATASYDVEFTNLSAILIRAGLPINHVVRPYLALGSSTVESDITLTTASPGFSDVFTGRGSDEDVFIGIGADFNFNNYSVNVEYSSYYDGDDGEVDGFTISFVVHMD